MKKYLLILIISFTSVSLTTAQFNVYHQFPDSNAWWIQKGAHLCPLGTYGASNGINYWLRGDTVIHGTTFHIMASTAWDQCNGEFPPQVYTATTACIREDSMKRIYVWFKNSPITNYDTLLYDFNVKVGDTLPPTFLAQPAGGFAVVTSIDSIKIGTAFRKQFMVKYNGWGGPAYDSIVEEMGSWNGVLGPIGPSEFSNMSLICFKHNQDSVGTCGNYEQYTGIAVEQQVPVKFTIYPNPAGTSITINYKLLQGQSNCILKLYNAMGQLLRSNNLRSGNGNADEDISTLSNGIYYYTLSLNGIIEATNKLVVIH